MRKINILFSFDNKFWKYAAVSIISVLNNKHPDTLIDVYCMVPHGTSWRAYRKIKKTVQKFRGCNLIWREIKEIENPFQSWEFKRWSPVIFYRLFVHKIFPHLNRILYMDSDTMARGDLWDLYNTDIGDNVMAAVQDLALTEEPNNNIGQYVRCFIKKHIPNGLYINSGILLINTTKTKELDDLAIPVGDIDLVLPDQDLINMKLAGRIFRLPLKYNFSFAETFPKNYNQDDIRDAKQNYVVYHFYTRKPFLLKYENRDVFNFFEKQVNMLGWTPTDLIRHETKFLKKKTHIPGLTISGTDLKICGITIMRLPQYK